jgi:hypothetical protein
VGSSGNAIQLDLVGLVLTFWSVGILIGSGWLARLELVFQERMTGVRLGDDHLETQAKYLDKLGKIALPISLAVFAVGIGMRFLTTG